ncbi:MAG: FCD domain-containing protein [Eubacteriales bacterium]|nr:FCD domain-containing protein [Eubacteriales bacterium]
MRKSASDQVVEYIQSRIREGIWTRGMKISTETQLQQETGFGKATVREAVEKLVAMGILKKRQGDGTYVEEYDAGSLLNQLKPELILNQHDIITILEFREIVEPACVRMFIDNYNQENVDKLSELLEVMREHQYDRNNAVFYEADRDFHLTIAQGTGNTILARVMEILNEENTKYHYTASRTIGAKSGVVEHERVLQSIQQKDAELGSLFMKRHIQRSRRDMQKYMEEA